MAPTAASGVRRFMVSEADAGQRLDRFMQTHCPDLSRSRSAGLARHGHVTVNAAAAKPSTSIHLGDVVEVSVPPPEVLDLVAQDIPLEIVYQDEHLLLVDKPAGIAMHPAPGHPDSTLVNALLALVPDLPSIGEGHRPGIVHRLDKDTSGLLMVAKTEAAHASLTRQLHDREVKKTYLALVQGRVKRDEGEVDGPISRHPRHRQKMAVVEGGREARTLYKVAARYADCTLVEASPVTGRTHQIRVHFAAIGHPLVGDFIYGKRSPLVPRQFLHAARLAFHLPPEETEWREFESALPEDLQAALDALGMPI